METWQETGEIERMAIPSSNAAPEAPDGAYQSPRDPLLFVFSSERLKETFHFPILTTAR